MRRGQPTSWRMSAELRVVGRTPHGSRREFGEVEVMEETLCRHSLARGGRALAAAWLCLWVWCGSPTTVWSQEEGTAVDAEDAADVEEVTDAENAADAEMTFTVDEVEKDGQPIVS
ncbi:MAG: hypothetical protein AAFX99_36195, partial [Myxococcota bacterium]